MTCAVAMNESMMCEMYERQSINLKVIDKNKGNHYSTFVSQKTKLLRITHQDL